MTETAGAVTFPGNGSEPKPLGLLARLVGVLTSPRATYANIAAFPRWFGALALCALGIAVIQFAVLSTDAGREALLTQQEQGLEAIQSLGIDIPDQAYADLEKGVDRARYVTPISFLVILPIACVVTAGILLAIFTGILGGSATFKQVYAVVAHGSVFTLLMQAGATLMTYFKQEIVSATRLSALVPFLEPTSYPARVLGALDLLMIWSTISLAIGLAVLYRRRTGPIAIAFLAIYGLFALAAAAFSKSA